MCAELFKLDLVFHFVKRLVLLGETNLNDFMEKGYLMNYIFKVVVGKFFKTRSIKLRPHLQCNDNSTYCSWNTIKC